MYEVDSYFLAPKILGYEFSEIRFISLKEIQKYKLTFGVRKEIRRFLKNKTISYT